MYQTIWKYLQQKNQKSDYKNRCFLFLISCIWSVVGAIVAGLISFIHVLGIFEIICCISTFGILIGLYGSIAYLYRHNFT